jgi:hypothetical protein
VRNFIGQMFRGTRGDVSSKRTVTLFAFLFLSIAFLANLIFGVQVSEFMFEYMTYIVLAGLGMATMEPLTVSARSRNDQSTMYTPDQEELHQNVD